VPGDVIDGAEPATQTVLGPAVTADAILGPCMGNLNTVMVVVDICSDLIVK
jgi:hypothetical protein